MAVSNEKPWVKWVGLIVLVLGVGFLAMRFFGGGGTSSILSADGMAEVVSVKYEDTGETINVPVGRIVRELMDRPGQASEDWKLNNPKTHKLTGVVESGKWSKIIKAINEAKVTDASSP